MVLRAAIGRRAHCAFRQQCQSRRGLASAASGTFTYETGEAAGVKYASRDLPGPTTHVAVVARAGTRYQQMPGFTDGLEKFAFKNTTKRSALRITRESELLGSELQSYHTRENLIIGAKFLRDDLPYFVELLGEVISNTKYTLHQFQEEVLPIIKLAQKSTLADTAQLALNSAHGVAFHRGLGSPLHPVSSSPFTKYLSERSIEAFSQAAYPKDNIAVVANGTSYEELSRWVGEFFTDCPPTPPANVPKLETPQTKYYGGEERIAHDSGNNMILAFPGSGYITEGFFKPEIPVLAALLGGQTTIKWSPGFSLLSRTTEEYPRVHVSTDHHTYSDAGLMCISLSGDASQMRRAATEVVKTIRKVAAGEVSKEDVKKAAASAKFIALEAGQSISTGIELTGAGLVHGGKAFQIDEIGRGIGGVTEEQVKKAAKSILEGKATVSTVGDLYLLPFAEEMGLNV